MDNQDPSKSATWEDLQRKVQEAHCTIHRSAGAHIVVVEDIWLGSNGIGEQKPFLRAFPDNEAGYITALSTILRRYPHLNDAAIVCAVCSQAKSPDQYDSRFWGKPTKKVCASCRDTPRPVTKRAQAYITSIERLESTREEYQEKYPRHRWQFTQCASIKQIEDIAQQIEAERTNVETWRTYCRSLGFDDDDMRRITHVHGALGERPLSWLDVKIAFLALDPPYLGVLERRSTKISLQQRQALYEKHQGRCAYCECDLLPLNYRSLPQRMAYWRDIPNFAGMVPSNGMVLLDRDQIPHLEHRIPIARGGTDDLDNLCYACRKCNQRKDVRTVEEFRVMPDDAISRLPVPPWLIMSGLLYEQRGYARFDDPDARQSAPLMLRGLP